MTYHRSDEQVVGLSTTRLSLGFSYSKGIRLAELCPPDSSGSVLGGESPHVVRLTIDGEVVDPESMTVAAVEAEDVHRASLASVSFECRHGIGRIRGRVSVLDRGNEYLELIVQLGLDLAADVPSVMTVAFPFLGALSRHPRYFRPGQWLGDSGPENYARYDFQEFPPAMLQATPGRTAFGFEFPGEHPFEADRNREIWRASAAEDPGACEIRIRPIGELADVMSMRLHASAAGRAGVFESWKRAVRRKYDLRRYALPGLDWCRRTYLHHFTYGYSKEIYNYETGAIEVDRLLDDGEEFGGYDALIYWHQYPRLGLDQRTQWDLYDDLPQGRASVREIVAACHDRGVRVFLPFKPWDVRASASLDDEAGKIGSLVADTGVDGFFLDTMATIPPSFTQLITDRFPELVFCSEGSPRRVREIRDLTASWDQDQDPSFVEVSMFRFVFPEHPKYMITRLNVGADKDQLIRRAVFNGMGLVIWQDVFGEWLPFSHEQKQRVRDWKSVLARYHDTFFGRRSVPLIDTHAPGLIANRFSDDPGTLQVVTITNSTAAPISGVLLDVPEMCEATCELLWGEISGLRLDTAGARATIVGSIPENETAVVCVMTKLP